MPVSDRVVRRSRQIACWSDASSETVLLMRTSCSDGRHAVGAAFGDAFTDLCLDTGDADHEELIKVIGGNRQEPDPLQRGMAGIDRLFEHPAVEM